MEKDQPTDERSEPAIETAFQRFEDLLKKVVSVPNKEAERIVKAVPSPTSKKKRRRKS